MLNHKILKILWQQAKNCQMCSRMLSQEAPQKHKMQAWQIHSYGGLDELQLTSARIPYIRNPDELLIEVKASSLNPIDSLMMSGYGSSALGFLRGYELEFPLTLGREFSGTLVDKGRGVGNEFQIGDNVYGIAPFHKQGSHAKYIITDKSQSLLQPIHLNATEAASILFAALTAWSSLFITGELAIRDPRQSKVLILGASGSVGSAATQILKSQNALVVGTCATDAIPLVQSLGADKVYDYSKPEHIGELATHEIFDIILDCAKFGYNNIPAEWKYNKYITLDSPLGQNLDSFGLGGGLVASLRDIVIANYNKLPEGKSIRWGFFLPLTIGLQFIDKLVQNRKLQPVIHKVFKFNEVPEAYKILATGHLRGKIVIDMQ